MKRRLLQRLYAGALCCCVSALSTADEPSGTTVYRSVGADGVVSFSDAPHASAVPIEVLPPPLPLQAEVDAANRAYEQQLELLQLLETSRHARAKEELERAELELDYVRTEAALDRARELQAPQYDDGDRYYPLFYPPYWGAAPRPPGFPGHRPPMGGPPGDGGKPPSRPSPPQQIQFPH